MTDRNECSSVDLALLQGLALQWEMEAHLMVTGAGAAARRCAASLYEVVGAPAERAEECVCGRLRFQHRPDEVCA